MRAESHENVSGEAAAVETSRMPSRARWGTSRPARRGLRRRAAGPAGARGRSGQVLAITLLAMTLLVGLPFYVYNAGASINQRVELQNVADSVAVSGAGWMARSMNLIAMNNVVISRMIAIAPVMDAQPLSVEMALEEARAWEECLTRQLALDLSGMGNARPMMEAGLQSLQLRIARQRSILDTIDSRINTGRSGFRMEELTTWSVPGVGGAPPHGKFWQAAMSCSEFSRAVLATAGELAADDAHLFGTHNGADASFLVPLYPKLPGREGLFQHFQPVLQGEQRVQSNGASYKPTGGAGGAIPDFAYPHRLGPWARLYKWRHYFTEALAQEWVSPTGGVGKVRGPSGIDLSGRSVGSSARTSISGHNGYWRTTDSEVVGYTTYGPYHWAMEVVDWYANDHYGMDPTIGQKLHPGDLADTYYYNYIRDLSNAKLGYMFTSKARKMVHYPQYHTLYPECVTLASGGAAISKTMFYMVDIASSISPSDPQWLLVDGTHRSNGEPPPRGKGYPMSIWVNGWVNPATDPKWRSAHQVGDYIWRADYNIEVTEDRELGISAQIDPYSGQPIWQTVYMTAFYIFGGIDTGWDREIADVANWDQFDSIPIPILLDTSNGDPYDEDHDLGGRRALFTFLGVARKNHSAPVVPQKFTNPNPLRGMVAVAQAEVFNKTSWDLWTQDWQVQLVPVSNWGPAEGAAVSSPPGNWVWQLDVTNPAVREQLQMVTNLVSEQEVQKIFDYMFNLSSMAGLYVNH
jgi:hypothetical protein